MASLSEKLKRERELRGISLKQISDDTNIGVRFLEALEEDRLELIPGEFYRRSYLRAYARYLGLDEDRAVNAYAFAHQEKNSDDESEEGRTRTGMVPWLPWALGAFFVAIIVVLFARPGPDPAESSPSSAPPTSVRNIDTSGAGASSSDESADRPGSASASASPGVPPAIAENDVPMLAPARERNAPRERYERYEQYEQASADGALRLVVAVGESCWLEIEADGKVVTTGLKEEGFRQEFTADTELRLWLGNAGGVSLWVNDKPLRSLGRDGQVRKDLSITPDNFMDFVSAEAGSS